MKTNSNWPVVYRWAAVGTLVAWSAVGSKTIHIAQAQDIREAAQANHPVYPPRGAAPVRHFDIPAGPLDTAVAALSQVSGWKVTAAKEGIGRLSSPGVDGDYTAEQALNLLLANTGVSARFTSATTVVLDVANVAASVDVTDKVEALATATPKYSGRPLDTPQTITSVPLEVIEQQGTTTLRDALRNVAGISLAAGEGGAQGDNLTIRGFAARSDLFIDGMRDFGSYYRDPFNTQEVEVLQGPSSVTFGRGSTGGVVNQATKAPGLGGILSGEADFGTDRSRRVALDIDRPLPRLSSGAAFRVNLMGHEGAVAGRDAAENRRFGVAPSLALGLGTSTRWTFSYFHQSADNTPDYGIPWLFNGPAPVARNSYYGFKHGNYLRTDDDIATVRVEHDVSKPVALRNQVRYARYGRDALITEALIPAGVTLSTPLATIAVTRHEIGVQSVEGFFDEQLDLTAHFETGPVRHDLVAGIEAGRESSDPIRITWTNVPTTSLLHPDPKQTLSGNVAITSNVRTAATTTAAYALDTLRLGRHWDVTGVVRWDHFDTSYRQSIAPASTFSRVDRMASWRAALVYEPVSTGSVYFAAGTSFNPSAESLSLSSSTADLPAEKNRTYEFGTKWDIAGRWLSLRAALFRTDKLNAREPDPNNSLLNVLAGTQRVKGAEFEARTRLNKRWDLQSSYALLDARLTSSNYYPAAVGAQLANVPRHTLNFWSTYRLPWHLETGLGGNYVSQRTASSTAPLDPTTGMVKAVPGYWVFGAMVHRPLAEHVDLQINVVNLANRYYYDQLHPAHIVPGAGRSALAGLKFRF